MNITKKPVGFSLCITRRCPCHCNWCNAFSSPNEIGYDMDCKDVENSFIQLGKCIKNGLVINRIHIIGGNPSSHPEYKKITNKIVEMTHCTVGDVPIRMFTNDLMSKEDIKFAVDLGCKMFIDKVSGKTHTPFPLDFGMKGCRFNGRCKPEEWNICNAIGVGKSTNGQLLFAACPKWIVLNILSRSGDSEGHLFSSMEKAIEFETKKQLTEKYCRYCFWNYKNIPKSISLQLIRKGIVDTKDLSEIVFHSV